MTGTLIVVISRPGLVALTPDDYWLGVRDDETATEMLDCGACKFGVTPYCYFVRESLYG
jgi:hypothetical protein